MPALAELIPLPPSPLISIVGAGGKTTTMYTLAAELTARSQRVITTTTTNIYLPQASETDTLIISPSTTYLLEHIQSAWQQHRRVTVASKMLGAGKIVGLLPDQPYELLQKSGADAIIVEADGARHLMIKAPAEYEPVVPPQTNVALLLISAQAINQPLTPAIAHRPERIAALLGLNIGDILTPVAIAQLITSEHGGMKNIPHSASAYVLITHAPSGLTTLTTLHQLAELVHGSSRIASVYCSAEPGVWITP